MLRATCTWRTVATTGCRSRCQAVPRERGAGHHVRIVANKVSAAHRCASRAQRRPTSMARKGIPRWPWCATGAKVVSLDAAPRRNSQRDASAPEAAARGPYASTPEWHKHERDGTAGARFRHRQLEEHGDRHGVGLGLPAGADGGWGDRLGCAPWYNRSRVGRSEST